MAINSVLPDDQAMKNGGAIRLSENLNRLMKKRKVSISQTAQAVAMNKSTLHNYCNGVVPRNVLTLKKLADYFEISLVDLIFGPQMRPESLLRAAFLEGTYELIIRRTVGDSKNIFD
jgi:transcriptional regulator with XRE-family HTH domain